MSYLAHVMFATVVFCVVVWPLLTYVADIGRYVWAKLMGGTMFWERW